MVTGARAMFWLAIAGTSALVATAFATSFGHLADVAARAGMSGGQAWTLPAMVDGAGIVATLAGIILPAKSGARRYAWGVLTATFALSLIGNVLDYLIPAGQMPAQVGVPVALLPPAAALVGLHLVVILGQWRATHKQAPPETVAGALAATVPASGVLLPDESPAGSPSSVADVASGPVARQVADGGRRAGGPTPAISREDFATWLATWRRERGVSIDARDERGRRPRPTYAEVAQHFGVREKTAGNAIQRHFLAEEERLSAAGTHHDVEVVPAREMVPA